MTCPFENQNPAGSCHKMDRRLRRATPDWRSKPPSPAEVPLLILVRYLRLRNSPTLSCFGILQLALTLIVKQLLQRKAERSEGRDGDIQISVFSDIDHAV
jgi:hypothetical protein